MIKAKVLSPICHLNRTYEKGDLIEVDQSTANQLVAAGVIVIATAPAPPAVAAVRASGPQVAPKGRD